ncbi:uncharacterized protein LOC135464409 [Liolophura sinensis]|uniref:uncharacterized protein LOC135464409 n=1 Tax=Liolophura sinensis TaxID=3198878 RepID=UPI0031589072
MAMFLEVLAQILFGIILICLQTWASDPSCGPDPQRYALNAEDINIAVFLDIHQPTSTGCGQINTAAVQELEAVSFVFERLNEANYIPGVKLGFVAYDTCSKPHMAAESLRHLLSRVDDRYVNSSCSNTSELIFGIAGPSTSDDAIAMSRILAAENTHNRLVQISHSASATVMTSSDSFSNTYSLVPPDDLQAKAVIELLKQLEWNYVALMHTDDTYGVNGAADIKKLANASGICLAFVEKLSAIRDTAQVQMSLYRILMYGGKSRVKTSGVVFFGSADIAFEVLKQAKTFDDHKLQFIFTDSVQFKPDLFMHHYLYASGALVVEPVFRKIRSLEDHLENIYSDLTKLSKRSETNPWLEEAFRKATTCNVSTTLTSCERLSNATHLYTTSLFTYYMTKLAFLYGKLIKDVYEERCARLPCSQLDNFSRETIANKLSGLSLSFSGEFGQAIVREIVDDALVFHVNGSRVPLTESSVVYEVKNLQLKNCPANDKYCFKKVGSFDGLALSLNVADVKNYNSGGEEIDRIPAQCPVGSVCEACLVLDAAKRTVYVPGDLVIVALAPVFDSGNEPFTCSGIRLDKGLQLAQSILFAVKKVNEKEGIFGEVFPGKSIGTLILNTCYSESVSLRSAMSVFFEDEPYSVSSVDKIASKVLGFVGAVRSDVSEKVASLLTQTKHVQISYASTSVTLSDNVTYPYFMRNCASDKLQGEIMVMVLKAMDWMYVSMVYVDDSYGQNGLDIIQTMAPRQGICIAQVIKVDYTTNYFSVLESLRRTPSSKVVILFLRSTSAKAMLEAISVKDDYKPGEFTFILTESVGNRESVISNAPAALGSISLLQELPPNNEFKDFLSQRKVTPDLPERVWLEEYWEPYFRCYRPTSYDKSTAKPCDSDASLTDAGYQQDPWAPFAINAVFSMVLGAHEAVRELCDSSGELCSQYRNNPSKVRDKILKTRLDLFATGAQISAFDDNGDGTVGFAVFNVQTDPSGNRIYAPVGFWSKDKGLSLEKDKLKFPNGMEFPSSVCPNERECNLCNSGPPSAQNYSAAPLIPTVGGVLGVVVVICIVIIIVLVYRQFTTPPRGKGKDDLYPDMCRSDPEDYIHALELYSTINDRPTEPYPPQHPSGQSINPVPTGVSEQSITQDEMDNPPSCPLPPAPHEQRT